jgi:hypothetical protein
MTPEEALAIVGARPGATVEEIKAAYRKKALELHPDRHAGASAKAYYEKRFKELSEAYELIKNNPPPAPAEPFVPEQGAGPEVRVPRSRWRDRADREPERVPLADKLDLRPSWDLEPIALWGVVIPLAILVLIFVVKFFAGLMNPQP